MTPTQMDALRAALKPFADEFVNHEPWAKHYNVGDTLQIGNHVLVTMGDLRRAAEAYAALEKERLERPVGEGVAKTPVCDHSHWTWEKHGRRCTCGATMEDFGD